MSSLWKRLLLAFVVLAAVLLAGVAGYMTIEGWNFFDSFYMTVISLTTVGYGEVRDLSTNGRIFTIFLLFSGMGILAYGMGTFTAFLVEGHLMDYLRGRKMNKKIQRMRNHFRLCGYRGEGRYALEELIKTKTPMSSSTRTSPGSRMFSPGRIFSSSRATPPGSRPWSWPTWSTPGA